jgi:hypothetical protein
MDNPLFAWLVTQSKGVENVLHCFYQKLPRGKLSMTATRLLKLCAALGALHAGMASAALAWNNGPPALLLPGASNLSDTRQAEDFTLTTTSNLTSITFWTLEQVSGDFTGSIYYEVFSDLAGAPGLTSYGSGIASVTRTAAGSPIPGYSQFQNDMALVVANLAAGTYWIALHNGPLASTGFTDFGWSWTDPNPTNAASAFGQEMGLAPLTGWSTNSVEHAFSLYADPVVVNPPLPEPATWLLVGAGVAALARRQRRAN